MREFDDAKTELRESKEAKSKDKKDKNPKKRKRDGSDAGLDIGEGKTLPSSDADKRQKIDV